jgi:hypothetical protein
MAFNNLPDDFEIPKEYLGTLLFQGLINHCINSSRMEDMQRELQRAYGPDARLCVQIGGGLKTLDEIDSINHEREAQ